MTTLYVYGTAGCHLCEQAEAILEPLLDARFTVEVVDISESDELMQRYGVRIPVFKRADSGREIGWPFDAGVVHKFLR